MRVGPREIGVPPYASGHVRSAQIRQLQAQYDTIWQELKDLLRVIRPGPIAVLIAIVQACHVFAAMCHLPRRLPAMAMNGMGLRRHVGR